MKVEIKEYIYIPELYNDADDDDGDVLVATAANDENVDGVVPITFTDDDDDDDGAATDVTVENITKLV